MGRRLPGSALLASVLLRRAPAVAAGIPFAAGLALVDVLAATTAVSAGLKWPNDVLVDGRKLAGILSEVEPAAADGHLIAIALGLGVNLRVDSFPTTVAGGEPAHRCVEPARTPRTLLVGWGAALGVRIATLEARRDRRDPRRLASLRGRPGWPGDACRAATGIIDGVALDVDDDGALLVEASGQTHRFLAGDVHLGTTRPAEGRPVASDVGVSRPETGLPTLTATLRPTSRPTALPRPRTPSR